MNWIKRRILSLGFVREEIERWKSEFKFQGEVAEATKRMLFESNKVRDMASATIESLDRKYKAALDEIMDKSREIENLKGVIAGYVKHGTMNLSAPLPVDFVIIKGMKDTKKKVAKKKKK